MVHIYVDKLSNTGNVYIKSPSVAAAQSAVAALHGRWFAGKYASAVIARLLEQADVDENEFNDGAFRTDDHRQLRAGGQLSQPLPRVGTLGHAARFSSSLRFLRCPIMLCSASVCLLPPCTMIDLRPRYSFLMYRRILHYLPIRYFCLFIHKGSAILRKSGAHYRTSTTNRQC